MNVPSDYSYLSFCISGYIINVPLEFSVLSFSFSPLLHLYYNTEKVLLQLTNYKKFTIFFCLLSRNCANAQENIIFLFTFAKKRDIIIML